MARYIRSLFRDEDVSLFEEIRRSLECLPKLNLGRDEEGEEMVLDGHMLSRAVSEVFDLECVDGIFLTGYNHSWVKTGMGNIIDVFPVGIYGSPMLIDTDSRGPGRRMYHPAVNGEWDYLFKIQFNRRSFERATAKITHELRLARTRATASVSHNTSQLSLAV